MIIHALKKKDWERAKKKGTYKGDTLAKNGFIHCSPIEKIVDVANYNFKGIEGLVLLCIDEDRVISEIKWEDLYNEGRDYPHIYGELNIDSVIDVFEFEPNKDGYFELPGGLKNLK
ncbi:DUF952 domain-containing protein [Alkalicella caledoniensis]|uniref:DUF952 domain-containing protein n=1 Tax=Alkalicella caledoniensis TaxID=2731377 RepID=A0A7G9W6N3_ALKCA|nr:DUF952 domain-containing protein [Alkalicella caledoniensis]QNO14345.1 DUF952 domain-containing protein [Alkalicella caledoniensis]